MAYNWYTEYSMRYSPLVVSFHSGIRRRFALQGFCFRTVCLHHSFLLSPKCILGFSVSRALFTPFCPFVGGKRDTTTNKAKHTKQNKTRFYLSSLLVKFHRLFHENSKSSSGFSHFLVCTCLLLLLLPMLITWYCQVFRVLYCSY